MDYIAFTVNGLEDIATKEIKENLKKVVIKNVLPKRVEFSTDSNIGEITQLKTVDDIGFLCDKYTINDLNDIQKRLSSFDLLGIVSTLRRFREVEQTFSLTVHGVGWNKKSYSDLKENISKIIHRKYSFEYTPLHYNNLDIRLFIDHKNIWMSIRLTPISLHKRSYKTEFKEGSLHATIAAAMVNLSLKQKTRKDLKLVDNFCGSGTILCESVIAGFDVFGGDIDTESVKITNSNLNNLKYSHFDRVKVLNAFESKWADNYFDTVVSNLPWNDLVKVDSFSQLYEKSLKEAKRIVKSNGTLVFLVVKPDLFIKYAKKYFPKSDISTHRICWVGKIPGIIAIYNP